MKTQFMKLRQIGMGILLCLISIPCVQAQTYKKLWKQVEQAEEKSLPETVVKLTDVIYRKGEKEKNSPQMLKAYMWRMKYRDIIVPDSFYVGLQGLEQWAQQTDIPMDRAILHSLIAGIYADYVEKNQIIATVGGENVYASLSGILRGIIYDNTYVKKGLKIADIDPRKEELQNCYKISDKARCIAGGTLEALLNMCFTKNIKVL